MVENDRIIPAIDKYVNQYVSTTDYMSCGPYKAPSKLEGDSYLSCKLTKCDEALKLELVTLKSKWSNGWKFYCLWRCSHWFSFSTSKLYQKGMDLVLWKQKGFPPSKGQFIAIFSLFWLLRIIFPHQRPKVQTHTVKFIKHKTDKSDLI